MLKFDETVTNIGTVANTAQPSIEENALDWPNKDKRRMLHVVYRVGDLEKTIKYIPHPSLSFYSPAVI